MKKVAYIAGLIVVAFAAVSCQNPMEPTASRIQPDDVFVQTMQTGMFQTATIFEATFEREKGYPQTEITDFSLSGDLKSSFVLKVYNGDADGDGRVSSAAIWINDTLVAGPSDFSQDVENFKCEVELLPENTIQVELRGKPGSSIKVLISETVKPEPLKIGAIFAETGPAAFIGDSEAKTVRMLTDQINAAGGINGREIELIIKDSQANAANAVLFAQQFAEADDVLAIIGPSTSGETMQIKNLCNEAGIPLISAGAFEGIVDPVAAYVFKTPPNDTFAVQRIYETMEDMGITKIGVVAANSSFGNNGKGKLEALAPDEIDIVFSETYDRNATDLTGLLEKVDLEGVEAVVNWSVLITQSVVARNIRDLDVDVLLFQSHGFADLKFVEAADGAAEGVIFPTGRLAIAESLPSSHPQKSLLVRYREDYRSEYGEEASFFGGHAYDALSIVATALETAALERDELRDAIEEISDFIGISGIFYFTSTDHNGLGIDSMVIVTVKNGEFVPYKPKKRLK